MIFVILGSQKFQFNRLLIEIDRLILENKITENVYAQIGYSDYQPQYFNFTRFIGRKEFDEFIENANLIITHGGTGAIISAVKKNKKVIAIPRLSRFGEHVDDHQIQIINQFKKEGIICGLDDCSELENGIDYVYTHDFVKYKSNTNVIIQSIDAYICKTMLGCR